MQLKQKVSPLMLDVEKVRQAKVETSPYEYMVVSDFIRSEWQERLIKEYPVVKEGGSFPLPTISYGEIFAALIDEMNGADFRKAVAEKFSVDLENKPTMFTVRGKCRMKDGKVHTDSESKIITVLLYMNQPWQEQGGKLRVLRSNDINDIASEISPNIGTLLIFKRSNHSFHGHLPFEGERKVIQMNWVTEQKYVDREQKRHLWSSLMKKLGVYS
jgi:hypothetical protein